jgi:hypothetical protein
MHPNIIMRQIEKMSELSKLAGSPLKRMRNGATMNDADKPNTSGKNKGKMRPAFSEKMNTNSPYNTK